MGNKVGLITPFLMLLAGAIASIIMYIRGYELTRMLWGLLIVLVIFYILGDIVRYLYATIRPRIIPTGDLDNMVKEAKQNGYITGSVVTFSDDEQAQDSEGMEADGFMSEDSAGYSDDEIEEYAREETEDIDENADYTENYDDEGSL